MDAATRARIFEPFFTTKTRARGSACDWCTASCTSTGSNYVESRLGEGTTVRVLLPLVVAAEAGEKKPMNDGPHEVAARRF